MSQGERDLEGPVVPIRRVLVALDASPGSLEALEGVVELAARWKAELMGLFVEDVDLLRLAAAASATRFLYPAAREEPLSGRHMERELTALAEGARKELARVATNFRVRWSFRTVRGRLPAEFMLAVAEADWLSVSFCFGAAGWVRGKRRRFGSAAQAAVTGTRPFLLPVGGCISTALPVLVVYDGSQGSEDAARFAAQFAQTYGNRLTLLLLSPADRLDPKIESEVLRLLGGEHFRLRVRAIDSRDKSDFLRSVRSEEGGVLVISGQSPLFEEETVGALMRETNKPLLIVGGRSGPGQRTSATEPPPGKT